MWFFTRYWLVFEQLFLISFTRLYLWFRILFEGWYAFHDTNNTTIPSTIPLNNPNTIQIPSSLVDSSLVSYVVILILHGLKSFLYFSGWLSMTLVIIGIILNMFGYILNTYGSNLKTIHHSYFYTYSFPQLLIVFLV